MWKVVIYQRIHKHHRRREGEKEEIYMWKEVIYRDKIVTS